MFKNILVPTDFTARSTPAVEIAVKLASHSQAKVDLLHVIKMMPSSTFDEFKDFYQKLEYQAAEEMQTIVTQFQNERVDIVPNIVYGNRVQEILRFAGEQQVDLIVVTSHTINLSDPATGWGTISYKIGVLARCPVMLVK